MTGAPGLAGRAAELAAAEAVLTAAAATSGLLVNGAAGMGKSRLVAEAADRAGQAGVTVLNGWCLPLSEALPFLPILDVLRSLWELEGAQVFKAAVADCAPFVRSELDELLGLGPDVARSQRIDGSASTDAWRRTRVFEAVRQVLQSARRQLQIALIVEDVHWADPMTLDFLEYTLAGSRLDQPPIVMTCRTRETLRATVSQWAQRLVRNPRVQSQALGPLTLDETTEQITLLIGSAVDSEVVESVFRRTDGHPLFTAQLVAHIRVTPGALRSDLHGLPPELVSLLSARFAELDREARLAAEVIAISGRPLDETVLHAVIGGELASIRDSLSRLEARDLVRFLPTGECALSHAVLGEALSGDLLPGVLRQLHAEVAKALAGTGRAALTGEVAEHLQLAGDPAGELTFRIRAARHAETMHAAAEAETHWSRAAALLDVLPPDALPARKETLGVFEHAVRAHQRTGDHLGARAVAEQALKSMQPDADTAEQALLFYLLGRACAFTSSAEADDMLRHALALFDTLPPTTTHVELLMGLENQSRNNGDYDEASRFAHKALELAEQLNLRHLQLHLTVMSAWHAMADGDDVRALDTAEAAIAGMSWHSGDPALEHVTARVAYTDILLKLGRLDHVASAAADGLDIARSSGLERSFPASVLRGNAVEALRESGRTADAARLVDAMTDQAPPTNASWSDHAWRADLDMLRGRPDDARARWKAMEHIELDLLDFRIGSTASRAELDLWSGAPADVLTRTTPLLRECATTDESRMCGPLLLLALRACADLADLARATGDHDGLADVIADAEQLRAVHAAMVFDPLGDDSLVRTGSADRATWEAEWRRLQGDNDATSWAEAAAAWANLRRPHRTAYARWREADALLGHRDRATDAAQALRSAATLADGHAPLSDRIIELARRARVPLPGNAPATTGMPLNSDTTAPDPAGRFGLTERELTVLQMVCDGKTNTEIGRALYISPKTASVHVSNILRKLDVKTRTHAATIAQRAGLIR